jgi:DNA-binding transcriptional ArsR family regulator
VSEPAPPPYLDAAKLVGLLADDDRRRVVAALVLGAADSSSVVAATDLPAARVGRAMARLEDAGLVERGRDGTLVLIGQAFAHAARAAGAAGAAGASDRAGVDPTDASAVAVSRFMRDGRLVSIPVARGKRLAILEVLSEEFEPGRHYSESMVNLILGRWHPDTAALRRYLVDEGFLDRAAGEYWRAGGPVVV